jgi:hypothetical protein
VAFFIKNDLKNFQMKKIYIFLFGCLLPLSGFCWSAAGHHLGGSVAYWYLFKNNPKAIENVASVLKKHPWFHTEWKTRIDSLPINEKEIGMFMLASTFPDEARKTPYGSGEKSKWHYINYQFNPQNLPVPEMAEINAEQKLVELLGNIGKQKDSSQKAIDLCWIFHILEDIHQPLHTTALFDQFHKKGDKGGNDTWFVFVENGKPIRLHSFWDGLIKGSFDSIPALGKQLIESQKYALENLPEISQNQEITDWTKKESFELAKTTVYKNGTLNGIQDSPSIMPISYKTESFELAEKRVVMSGIRLGKKLSELFGS